MRDISRALYAGHPNWPGDVPLEVHPGMSISRGDSVNTSWFSASTHTGTHVDAPYHYDERGARLDSVPLEVLCGPCWVLDVRGWDAVPVGALPEDVTLPERVLLYTGEPARWEAFPEHFTPLHADLIYELRNRGVRLIGTDAPSVDPLTSKDLPAHHACFESGIFILEGLNLEGVAPGPYELLCLPLPLAGADAAPARAVLR
ncbi:arylformamidase [Deinobacterium chartae]|uniref:Kynurenine formamidase n=1 Tax=Deinobacterium chartae TaxID=521158 RepID=A0A841I5R5_9DEIO|nr:cyclase family protein [Deinobacterium chartae]MBB6099272.1 arylformamidase [Deinobacterium chartae]